MASAGGDAVQPPPPGHSAASSTIRLPSSSTDSPVARASVTTDGCQSTLPASGPPMIANQRRVRTPGQVAEPAIDADRHAAHVALGEVDGALGLAIEPEHLPRTLDRHE